MDYVIPRKTLCEIVKAAKCAIIDGHRVISAAVSNSIISNSIISDSGIEPSNPIVHLFYFNNSKA